MIRDAFSISQLIARYLCNSLTAEEEQTLMEWVNASPANRELFDTVCSEDNWARYAKQASQFDVGQAKQELRRRLLRQKRKMVWQKVFRYAAILLIPAAMVTVAIYYVSDKEIIAPATTPVAVMPQVQPILPGGQKARLQLSTGDVVDLEQKKNLDVEETDGTSIKVINNRVNYQEVVYKENPAQLYNTLVVPRGGEYSVRLSDATVVHLNAMSTLRYPVQFSNDERVVELQGEAFFDVQRSGIPFIVKTPRATVEVLGTTFNISAYEGESTCATLVEGKIKISTDTESLVLRPSQQAVIQQHEENILVSEVDANFYSSWYQGKIYFRDASLKEIMKVLSRWYNIQVAYGDSRVGEQRFGCYVNRHKEITPLLRHLERTGKVRIVQRENKIWFYSIQ